MNKLFTLLASVGLLYSCTKEAPLVQTPSRLHAESSYSSSDSIYEGAIRFRFTAEVAPFEEVVGGLDEAQQARGISTTINTNEVATRQFINLRAMGDEKGTIKGFLKVYDKGTNKSVSFMIDMKVSEDGKTVSYDGLFDRYTGPDAERLKAMLSSNLKDVYASIIIGSNGQNTLFDNKGAYSFVWQNGAQLPADFVMLKSEENKLEVRTDEDTKHRDIIFKDKESIKLKLQGYLMILQFHNSFPKYALKPDAPANPGSASRSTPPSPQATEQERVERPPLKVKLEFSSELSLVHKTMLQVHKGGIFRLARVPGNAGWSFTYDLKHFAGIEEYTEGNTKKYRYLEALEGPNKPLVIEVPVSSKPSPTLYPSVGDRVVALYFPTPSDFGMIAYNAIESPFYNASDESMTVPEPGKPSVRLKILGRGSFIRKPKNSTKKMEGKVYYPTLPIQPEEIVYQ
nr:hypothetical protein [uncultured Porphyromonas sp.]